MSWNYQSLVYLLQTGNSFGAIYYTVRTLTHIMKFSFMESISGRKRCIRLLLLTLYILCTPMITFMNFTILTDSLGLSFLLIMVSELLQVMRLGSVSLKNILIIGSSYIAQALLRADRMYNAILMIVLCVIVILFKKNIFVKRKIQTGLIIIIVCVISFGVVKITDLNTQVQGA